MGKERYGNDERVDRETVGNSLGRDRVDGGETVGNSLGRAAFGRSTMEATTGCQLGRVPLIRSEMEATTRWTEGKLWEVALGEFRCEKRDGSNHKVDGGETVGNRYPQLLTSQERFYTQKLLHREVFLQRSLHSQRLLHREAFYTEQLFHRGAFSRKSLYTQRL